MASTSPRAGCLAGGQGSRGPLEEEAEDLGPCSSAEAGLDSDRPGPQSSVSTGRGGAHHHHSQSVGQKSGLPGGLICFGFTG